MPRVLIRRGSLDTQNDMTRGEMTGRHKKKMDVHKPRREFWKRSFWCSSSGHVLVLLFHWLGGKTLVLSGQSSLLCTCFPAGPEVLVCCPWAGSVVTTWEIGAGESIFFFFLPTDRVSSGPVVHTSLMTVPSDGAHGTGSASSVICSLTLAVFCHCFPTYLPLCVLGNPV